MLILYRRYLIWSVVIAACVALGVITIWSWVVGYNVSGTLEGLIASLVLFFGTLVVMLRFFNRKSNVNAEEPR